MSKITIDNTMTEARNARRAAQALTDLDLHCRRCDKVVTPDTIGSTSREGLVTCNECIKKAAAAASMVPFNQQCTETGEVPPHVPDQPRRFESVKVSGPTTDKEAEDDIAARTGGKKAASKPVASKVSSPKPEPRSSDWKSDAAQLLNDGVPIKDVSKQLNVRYQLVRALAIKLGLHTSKER